MVRCFIGIFLPEDVKSSIKRVMDEISGLRIDAKFVEMENLHISLSFLGEVEENQIDIIKKKLDKIASENNKIKIKIVGLKAIPSEKFIRVLAFDILATEKVKLISKNIQREIGGDAKPPHITICRIRKIAGRRALLDKLVDLRDLEIGEMVINKIQLIESELSKRGPTYTVIHESELS